MLFADYLALPDAPRSVLVEQTALRLAPVDSITDAISDHAISETGICEDSGGASSGEALLTFSTHGFTSAPADTPASTWYDGRVISIRVDRQIYTREGMGGLTEVRADVVLDNRDGGLDDFKKSYAVDGRASAALLGRPTDPRSDYGIIFSGVVAKVREGDTTLTFEYSDGLALLDVPLVASTYAGTGTLEGGADLAGKPKPSAYGNCSNVRGVLVDSANLIWQVNDGAISGVPKAFDRGIELTQEADYVDVADMYANQPSAGCYRVLPSSGYVRLRTTPTGEVTFNVLGDATGGYVNKAGDIVNRILATRIGLAAGQIDAAAIAALNAAQPAEMGIWTGTEGRQALDAVLMLLESAGAFGGFSRLGVFTCGVVAKAAGAAADSFDTTDILRPLARVPLPESLDPSIWRARVGYARSWTVQTDLAAAVPAAQRTFAAEPIRYAKREDTSIRGRHPLSPELVVDGLFAQSADADTEALRLLNLWKNDPQLLSVPLPLRALQRDIGDVLTLTHPRFGLANGVDVRIIGHAFTLAKGDEQTGGQGARVLVKVLA